MLVGDQDCLYDLAVDTFLVHERHDLLAAQTHVYHDGLAVTFYDGTVPVATAGEYMYLEHTQTFFL